MFNKKIKIDDIYFAKLGTTNVYTNKSGKERVGFKAIKYVCVKINSQGHFLEVSDVLNGNNYRIFSSSFKAGEVCVHSNIKPAREMIKNQKFKIIDKNIINEMLIELDKSKEERNFKKVVNDLVKINKIRVVKTKSEESLEK